MTTCGSLPPISLVPGDSWNEIVQINDQDGVAIDLTGWTITMAEVRRLGGSSIVALVVDTADLADGQIGISADAEDTTAVPMGKLSELEIEGYPPGGSEADKKTLYFGPVTGVKIATTNIITVNHVGFQGIQGIAATIEVGSVTTLAPGAPATITNSGTAQEAVFDFGIPEGDKGDQGDAATIEVGTVTTLDPGEPATVVNAGTSGAASFDFGIPRGEKGDTGDAYETYGVSVYRAAGILTGSYYADRSASAGSTQAKIHAEIIAGDPGAEVDAYLEINGAVAYGPLTVAIGTPVELTGLSVDVDEGDVVAWVVTYMTGNVTDFFAKSYGAVA